MSDNDKNKSQPKKEQSGDIRKKSSNTGISITRKEKLQHIGDTKKVQENLQKAYELKPKPKPKK